VSSKRQLTFLLYSLHNRLHLFNDSVILFDVDIKRDREIEKCDFHDLLCILLKENSGGKAERGRTGGFGSNLLADQWQKRRSRHPGTRGNHTGGQKKPGIRRKGT
jgi:hypothetical protein